MSSACQCHVEGVFCFYCEVYAPVVAESRSHEIRADEWAARALIFYEALREIDTHIRATSHPIPHIVATLKRVLPEYSEEVGGFEDVRG